MNETRTTRAATVEMVGRNCPYCRFPIKEGGAVLECAHCHAIHHEDCWGDNGGCAITSCAGGPSAQPATVTHAEPEPEVTLRRFTRTEEPPASVFPRPAAGAVPPAGLYGHPAPPPAKDPHDRPTELQPPAFPPVPPPGDSSGRRLPSLWLIFGFVLLLAAIGGATAVLITKNHNAGKHVTHAGVTPPPSSGGTGPSSNPGGGDTGPATGDVVPASMTDAEIEQQSSDKIIAHQAALSAGDYSKAWDQLSSRKQDQFRNQSGGYDGWVGHQQQTFYGTDTSGITVQLKSVNRKTGEAVVYVSGFSDRQGCAFSGLTWTYYENSQWWYDPGYSTTPERRAKWEPRRTELLGIPCLG